MLFPFLVPYVTRRLLLLADRHWCAACERTFPYGIDEAFFPRFSSEEGREIGPVLTDEGACEVAVYTAVPRALFSGGKLNDFFTKRCVADKDPLFFSHVRSACHYLATTLAYDMAAGVALPP